MESYEEFCLKSLARMHVESGCKASHDHMEAQSSIRFHGSHALLPRLSDQQRAEMAEQRQRAMQREAERHTVRISSLLNRVQDVIQHVQEEQKAARRLTAAARGFLTRRLLQTEKIKLLNKIIQDSIEVIRAFQAATHQRRASFTMQDLRLQYRVRAQLHAARFDVHEIFFVWPLSDRLALLQQDRELHRGIRGKAMCEQNTPCQSSVTQNTLGFMRQRMLQRTQSQNTPAFSQKLKPA